ncbi:MULTISPECIES: alpha/beta hydrolase [Bacillaceae]|uniref:alpha/beta hydrolase n=1 Tax=Metabacillus sp. 22489 TaxID=3453928 RepID=UPI00201D5DFB
MIPQWLLYSIMTCISACVVFAFIASWLLLSPRRVSYEKTFKIGIQRGEIDERAFNSIKKEELFIPSYYGYKLHGMFFPVENGKKVVIIAHGITWSLFGSFKYVKMFQKRGFHVLLCDHRYHGLSGGKYTSYGFYEKDDLKAWIDYLEKRFGGNTFIGLLGESLGAASALELSKRDRRVKFCIADCSFSDFQSLLRIRLKMDFKLGIYPLIDFVNFIVKLKHGWSFPDISPIKGLEKTKTPILFIHGKEDTFIPLDMTLEMFRRKAGTKKLYLVPKAGHAEAFNTDPAGYEKKVIEFIQMIDQFVSSEKMKSY